MDGRIAAICPTYERLDLLRGLVRSFQASEPDPTTTLTLVCQGQDGSAGWAREQGLTVLESAEPLTFAKAVNLAASDPSTAGADWLLLLNNDLTLRPGFWTALAEMATLHYEIAGAKLLYPPDTQGVEQVQHFGGWFTLDLYPFHVYRYRPTGDKETGEVRACPWVTFACAAIRRSIWDALKGLNEEYVNGFEDVDFCLRAREAGAQIGVHPGMLATHLESQTTGKDDANKAQQWLRFQTDWIHNGRIQAPLGVAQVWRWS